VKLVPWCRQISPWQTPSLNKSAGHRGQGRHADRHAELAPVLNKVETAPMSAGLMIANVAACNGACPCHYPAR
jgi:hypothetical protein